MKLTNLNKFLKILRKSLLRDFKKKVHVQTGALKRSLTVKKKNNNTIIEMLEYGRDKSVWDDNLTPHKRLSKTQKKLKSKMSKAFKKDIQKVISNQKQKIER